MGKEQSRMMKTGEQKNQVNRYEDFKGTFISQDIVTPKSVVVQHQSHDDKVQQQLKELKQEYDKEINEIKAKYSVKKQTGQMKQNAQESSDSSSEQRYQEESFSLSSLQQHPQREEINQAHFRYVKNKQKLLKKVERKKARQVRIQIIEKFQAILDEMLSNKQTIQSNFDQLYNLHPKNTIYLARKLLFNSTSEEIEESKKLQEQFLKDIDHSNEDKQGLALIMLGLKYSFEKESGKFLFSKHSNPKTQLCVKILTSGFLQDLTLFQEHLEETQQWNYEEIQDNPYLAQKFINWFKFQKSQQYGINEANIAVIKISQGSIKVEWVVINRYEAIKVASANASTQKLKLHRYFQNFHLSPQDFDSQGNMEYDDDPVKDDKRGGWHYYPPANCKRYGLNVSQRYDNCNDKWLSMFDVQGEWAVAFHGVWKPDDTYRNTKVLNSIMKGLQKGSMLIAGGGQVHRGDSAINLSSKEKVGIGIYCSPHFQIALGYSQPIRVKSKEYHLVLQCRVNPEKIKVCSGDHTYWVMNEPKDIRPYGILLVKAKDALTMPSVQKLFGSSFNWQTHQSEISTVLE